MTAPAARFATFGTAVVVVVGCVRVRVRVRARVCVCVEARRMTVLRALHAAMDVLDTHKEALGSGPYCELADHMKLVADSMDAHAAKARRAFAMEMLLDVPACAAAGGMFEYTEDVAFMASLVRRKGHELQTYDRHVAALMGESWKIELTDTLLPFHNNDPCLLCDVRRGVRTLFRMRAGFLPQIVSYLNRKAITPQMLFPTVLNARPVHGDSGSGPKATSLLGYEPRFLRWLLGVGELEPWPRVADDGSQTFAVSELIVTANRAGGDDPSVNDACDCPSCAGVRIPTLDRPNPPLGPPVSDLNACDNDVP